MLVFVQRFIFRVSYVAPRPTGIAFTRHWYYRGNLKIPIRALPAGDVQLSTLPDSSFTGLITRRINKQLQ